MDANGATLLLFALLVLLTVCCCCVSVDQPDRPAESPERRVARALAEWEASAAAPVLTPLTYFLSWCGKPQPGGGMHPPKPRG